MTASRRRPFLFKSGTLTMAVVAISARNAVERFFKQLKKDGGRIYVTPLCEILSEGQPPMYFDMTKDETEIVFMKFYEVRTGNIQNTTIAATEIDAAANVLAKAIYENLITRKTKFRLGRLIEIKSEGGATVVLSTQTGEQIDPPTGAQEATTGLDT